MSSFLSHILFWSDIKNEGDDFMIISNPLIKTQIEIDQLERELMVLEHSIIEMRSNISFISLPEMPAYFLELMILTKKSGALYDKKQKLLSNLMMYMHSMPKFIVREYNEYMVMHMHL